LKPESHRRRWWLIALCTTYLALAGRASFADEPDEHLPVPGVCGKARLAARGWARHPQIRPPDPSLREALVDTDVLHYALDIEISNLNTAANNCTVTGRNVMTIRSLSPALTEFTFRLHSNYTITGSSIFDGFNTAAVSIAQPSGTTRVATLDRAYGQDETFLLTIDYTGTSVSIDDSISVSTQSGTPVVYTLSEPFGEYTWWPCKDGDVGQPGDNSDKATLEFSITTPNNFVVPSNGRLLGVDTLSGNRRRYRWATDYPITPYLVSFAATSYNTWTRFYNYPAGEGYPAGSMPVEFYIYPGSDTPTNRANWEKCLNMLATFRGIYGEYPFLNDKYGIYQFSYGGGMEHQTITGQGSFGESLTAHELSHQWWGDMITCKTWHDIWLNEGFATYSECLWQERKSGGIDTAAYFAAVNARRPTNNGASGSVYRYNVSSLNAIFSSTYAYNKGAWVLHMLRHVVGDATFFNILAAYRQAFPYGSTVTDDFAGIASAVSGKDLTPFFNQWVYHRGAPTYQFGWQSANVAGQEYLVAHIAQTQTPTSGSPPQILNVYEMPVDLVATIGGSPQTLVVQNSARTQWFVVPVSGPVTALSFDPSPWILRGAATSVAYVPGPPRMLATSPAPGVSIDQPASPTQISVTFHTPINATEAAFSVVGDNVGPRTFTLSSGAGVNPAVLNLAGPLPPDTYTLTVNGGVTAANSGMALDGEVADPVSPASFPTGDGLEGGIAVIRFAVSACVLAADIDADCDTDAGDLDLFVNVLTGADSDSFRRQRSDLDASGSPDGNDIRLFVAAFLAP